MRNLKKSLDEVTVCLKKIEMFLSCYFFLRTPWRILSGRGRLREFAQTVDIYSALVSNRRRRRNGKVLNGLSTLIHSHRSQQISNVGV